jgi:hypothetical protein
MPIHNNGPERYCSLVFIVLKPLELLLHLLLSYYIHMEKHKLIVVLIKIGDKIAYTVGLHFCCQEVYPYRNQNKV